jgi:hypothetical protein
MFLATHTNWITGSYSSDVLYLLKIAEDNALRLGTSSLGLHPRPDGGGSLFIGYGYDLVGNRSTALQDLTAAGATITNSAQFTQALQSLTRPATAAQTTPALERAGQMILQETRPRVRTPDTFTRFVSARTSPGSSTAARCGQCSPG